MEREIDVTTVLSRTASIFNTETFSDVTLIVGNECRRFPCHKLVLALASPFFARQFYQQEEGRRRSEMRLDNVAANTFYKLLKFIYTDVIELQTVEETYDVLFLAEKYEIIPVVKQCETFIEKHLILPDKVCEEYEKAQRDQKNDIIEACHATFRAKTSDVLKSTSFFQAKASTVEAIIANDSLTIESELEVIEAVATWAAIQNELNDSETISTRFLIYPFLKYMRFLTLTAEEFQKFINHHEFLTSSEVYSLTLQFLQPNSPIELPEPLCPIKQKRSKFSSSISSEPFFESQGKTQERTKTNPVRLTVRDSKNYVIQKYNQISGEASNIREPNLDYSEIKSNIYSNSVYKTATKNDTGVNINNPELKYTSLVKKTDIVKEKSKLSSQMQQESLLNISVTNDLPKYKSLHQKIDATKQDTDGITAAIYSGFHHKPLHQKSDTVTQDTDRITPALLSRAYHKSMSDSAVTNRSTLAKTKNYTEMPWTKTNSVSGKTSVVSASENTAKHKLVDTGSPTDGKVSDYASCSSGSESDSEPGEEDITQYRYFRFSLNESEVIQNGAMVVDVVCSIAIKMIAGEIALGGVILKTKEGKTCPPAIISLNYNQNFCEEINARADHNGLYNIVFSKPLHMKCGSETVIEATVEHLQLSKCAVSTNSSYSCKGGNVEFRVTPRSNQKCMGKYIPFLMKSFMYKHL